MRRRSAVSVDLLAMGLVEMAVLRTVAEPMDKKWQSFHTLAKVKNVAVGPSARFEPCEQRLLE